MRLVAILVMSAVIGGRGGAQAPTAARGADSAFARGDWNTALAGYLDLVRRDSLTPAVWFRLGLSHHNLGHFRDAANALARARRLGAAPFAVELALARAHARFGETDRALAHLDSASRAAGPGVTPATVRDDPDLASVRTEARFAASIARIEAIRYPCRSMPEARQFDFWIGKWDVAPWNGPSGMPRNAAGYNDVHPLLEQCLLLENWRAAGGGEGKSINFFDRNLRKWRQIWVADGGGSLDYTGEFRDGAMRFEGWTRGVNGGRVLQKLTFTPFGRDTVRQTFEASTDSGRTWAVTFDARYIRR